MIRIEEKPFRLSINSRPVVVKAAAVGGGRCVRVRDDAFLRMPRVVSVVDKTVYVNAVSRPVKIALKNTQYTLKVAPRPVNLAVNQQTARLIAVNQRGLPGAKGDQGDPGIPGGVIGYFKIHEVLAGNETRIVDRIPVAGVWVFDWWISCQDATLAARSYTLRASFVAAEPRFVKFGGIGTGVAFTTNVRLDGSDAVLEVTNASASELQVRVVRTIQGEPQVPGVETAAEPTVNYLQAAPAMVWTINHALGYYPDVFVQDLAGNELKGEVDNPDTNTTVITFKLPRAGRARLN